MRYAVGMFEAVEHIELRDELGAPVEERILGSFADEKEALEVARAARRQFLEQARDDYAWWTVRSPGARLARWIADSQSDREFALDLTTGQLVEVQ